MAAVNTGDDFERANAVMPGLTQLLSKHPRMFCKEWPLYYDYADCVNVYANGVKYLDFSYNGIGCCILGAQDPDVDRAVRGAIGKGVMSTLSCPEELELAEKLIELHPWADCVRLFRTGGEAMAAAVRIARAHTGRDNVAIGGYHGWHDWYLAANHWRECITPAKVSAKGILEPHKTPDPLSNVLIPGLNAVGVPRGLAGTAQVFHHNNCAEVANLRDNLAAICFEVQRKEKPSQEWLYALSEAKRRTGGVLICDEITSGFRANLGGLHLLYETLDWDQDRYDDGTYARSVSLHPAPLEPDIAVFGKALGNGYAISAVIGKREVMDAARKTFISSTMWTERIGPTAALATIEKFGRIRGWELIAETGRQWIKEAWNCADTVGLDANIGNMDMPSMPYCYPNAATDEEARALKTLMTQGFLERGILFGGDFYATAAHTEEDLERFVGAMYPVFRKVAEAQSAGNAVQLVGDSICESRFERLTR